MIYDARDCARLRLGVLLVSATAWVIIVAMPERSCHDAAYAYGTTLEQMLATESLAWFGLGWLLMMVAMMAPISLPALYHIRVSSFAGRRWRSSALFLAGYGAVWMAAGVVLEAVKLTARSVAPRSYGAAVAIALVACVWQASPIKQRCMNRCHSHQPLAAFGVDADWDALRMGLEHGFWCVGSCWAVMLFPMLLLQAHLIAMVAVSVLMFCERLDPPRPPAWRLRGFHATFRWSRTRLFGPRGEPPPYTAPAIRMDSLGLASPVALALYRALSRLRAPDLRGHESPRSRQRQG